MKREYISPEIEVQKFTFENILAAGDDIDDKGLIIKDSRTENNCVIYEEETGPIG